MKTIELIETPGETTFNRVLHSGNLETQYTPDDFVGTPDFNTRYGREDAAYVILDAGFVLAIVFGCPNEQDALDEAVNANKLDGLAITQEELKEYETGEYADVGNEYSPSRSILVPNMETEEGSEVYANIEHGGWPVYDGRVVSLGNADEPFDLESLDIWQVSVSVFAEDPALMTIDRVIERLEDVRYEAERVYKALDVYHDDWSNAYRECEDLKDAMTLLRFARLR